MGEDRADVLGRSESFDDLRSSVVDRNDGDRGRFVKAVRRLATKCSSEELRLLLAICAVLDFAHLADDLARGQAWQDDRMRPALPWAIAACVLATP
jgi:hypothetical protein